MPQLLSPSVTGDLAALQGRIDGLTAAPGASWGYFDSSDFPDTMVGIGEWEALPSYCENPQFIVATLWLGRAASGNVCTRYTARFTDSNVAVIWQPGEADAAGQESVPNAASWSMDDKQYGPLQQYHTQELARAMEGAEPRTVGYAAFYKELYRPTAVDCALSYAVWFAEVDEARLAYRSGLRA